jgi:hypothetical protein
VLTIGLTIMMATVFWTMFTSMKAAPPVDRKTVHAALDAARQIQDGSGVFSATADKRGRGSATPSEAHRLAAMDPVEARCFATERYRVGDRGLRRLRTPDPALVQAFLSGREAGSSEVVLERYLAMKERSVRSVTGTQGADVDEELLAYVRVRKSLLWVVHRFFDDAGLRIMQEAYDSPADGAVLAQLRERLHEGAPALRAEPKLAKEAALLILAPQDFVPCVARAEAAGPGTPVHANTP